MDRIKYLSVVLLCVLFSSETFSQRVEYKTENHRAASFSSVVVKDITEGWDFRITDFKEPAEGNPTYRYYLQQLKEESARRYPKKPASKKTGHATGGVGDPNVPVPKVLRNFTGNAYNYSAPNDNTIAISNDGQLISAINTNIYFYDMKEDSLMKKISLNNFCSTLSGLSTHQYDPKLIYDFEQDRFIIVFLAGASSDTKTNIVVGFSETNDMLGKWNLYALDGNPVKDSSWTDFPAIALSKDELFITVNLLDYGTSWQTSFRQTVIWQVDKFAGYQGDTLTTRLWKDIAFDERNIRNMHPIIGAEKLYGPNMYFLSNRNFTLYSDSIFLVEVSGNLADENATLSVQWLKSDVGYGAPPDAGQPVTTNVLATNDARVLGGIYRNNTIQFVGNTIDTTTGYAVIYHGIISNVSSNPKVRLKLLTEPGMEFGYPNISYSGNSLFSQQTIIGFNHTGDTTYPGVSVVFYDGAGSYSGRVSLRDGDSYIDLFTGTYERWGDYSGNQRKYDQPGVVWVAGMFGLKVGLAKRIGTQIAEIATGVEETPVVIRGKSLDASLYPNPLVEDFGMEFILEESMNLRIELRSMAGQREHLFFDGTVGAGKHALTFSTHNLAQGIHLLIVSTADGKILFSEKVIKTGD